ncbi:pyruvate formate lyase-activating protein [Brevibacillus sp. SKDU10]|uniref:pyruvate formate-lyase-activating protein n=1 Tax=Brevibacillus sp. SKDU10 TaxID=1247872 RepID=UPI0007C9827B|nr:pyruvate formate-lyase-activating protein [Brevibacillus sp. SKDU10]OAJ76254.1 pyruvate formate lyase-activating protein [Brevibacillus sp. SKDU10]
MKGRIHSLETFGTVDGPGIRFVLFLQGCALKCKFCHNADTWDTSGGTEMTVDEVLAEIEPYLNYYRNSGGGLTVTGGEPTLQAPFVTEVFTAVKEKWGLHTTLDSSGFCDTAKADKLLEVTDLVLLDLKQMNREKHIWLTSQPNDRTLAFAKFLSDRGKKMWIRHVLIPGITDSASHLLEMGEFIGSLQGVEKVEILPYHEMGVYKWEELGKAYPLKGQRSPSEEEVKRAYELIEKGRTNQLQVIK